MKKIMLCCLICIGCKVYAQSNVYHPFPESNAQWNFNAFTQMGACHKAYSIEVFGDTIINSNTYFQLITHGAIDMGSFFGCNFSLPTYLGAIRNDTAHKKVYFVPPLQQNEELLYDFKMQVGDTVKGYLSSFASNLIVYEKDSILVNGNYRNRLKVDSCYYVNFIEGIGSDYGLIQILPGCITDANYYYLSCFKENNVIQYPGNVSTCTLIDGIADVSENIDGINISPNPSHDDFKIVAHKNALKALKVFDINGKLIKEEILNNVYFTQIQGLNSGFYNLQIKDSKMQLHHIKIIKMN